LFAECVEFSSVDICLELTVPPLGIECGKPLSQFGHLFRREVLNLLLDLFNLTHGGSIARQPDG
jgi:hypothetical protein